MPQSKQKSFNNLVSETKFLEDKISKLLNINQQLDLRCYQSLAIGGFFFIFSLFNVLKNDQKGVIGYLVIAIGSLISSALAAYALKPFNGLFSYEQILLNGLINDSLERFIKNTNRLVRTPKSLVKLYYWQLYFLFKISNKKRNALERAIAVFVITLLVGLILFITLP